MENTRPDRFAFDGVKRPVGSVTQFSRSINAYTHVTACARASPPLLCLPQLSYTEACVPGADASSDSVWGIECLRGAAAWRLPQRTTRLSVLVAACHSRSLGVFENRV
jgi:hypothetical protein